MTDGMPYQEAARLAKVHNPLIVNPLARWGSSHIWRACKRARRKGLVRIKYVRPDIVHIFALEGRDNG